jgi:hypothetical protein
MSISKPFLQFYNDDGIIVLSGHTRLPVIHFE